MQVWKYTESDAHGLVQTIIRCCHESQDTRVHRAAIHALIAAVKACWTYVTHVCWTYGTHACWTYGTYACWTYGMHVFWCSKYI